MIDFKKVTPALKDELEGYLSARIRRSCDYSFANLYAWEQHEYAVVCGMLVMRYLAGDGCYLFPSGNADAKDALGEILSDAHQRGKKCIIKAMTADEAALTEAFFPGHFRIKADRDSFDYIYLTENIAELKGKHYHGKRGHYAKFRNEYPAYTVSRICQNSIPKLLEMLDRWYASRSSDSGSLVLERTAIMRLLEHRHELGAVGLMLQSGGDILAFTLGSLSSPDTFDVHFEKASPEAPTAYTAINIEFAKYVRANYPYAVYLNREDDMGIEGLRRAKESWHPHRMIEKYTAVEVR